MPGYTRYSKKRYYNKKRGYKKKTFSRFNTYKHRSSKAQAYQIYKLNKKVNRINKNNAPDIHNWTTDKLGIIQTHKEELETYEFRFMGDSTYGYIDGVLDYDQRQTFPIVDNEFKIRRIKVWGTFTKFHVVNLVGDVSQDKFGFNGPLYYRLVILQSKGSNLPDVNNYLCVTDDTEETSISSPVQKGVNKEAYILYDKVGKITSLDAFTRSFKISFVPKYRNIQMRPRLSSNDVMEHPMHFYCYTWYNADDSYAAPKINLSMQYRVYYTDT